MSLPLSWGQVHLEEDYKDHYWLVRFKTTAQSEEEAEAVKEREAAKE